jgi:hypothetical protein
MNTEGPRVLADRLLASLNERGPYNTVSILEPGSPIAADSIVIDSECVRLDPGRRAKGYSVGFGAGQSTVSVSGSVKNHAGSIACDVQAAAARRHRRRRRGFAR